jgi:hypothetical protein
MWFGSLFQETPARATMAYLRAVLDSLARYWARYEPEKWPDLRSMLDSYFYPSNDDSLQETMERVKADCLRAEVDAILADIVDVHGHFHPTTGRFRPTRQELRRAPRPFRSPVIYRLGSLLFERARAMIATGIGRSTQELLEWRQPLTYRKSVAARPIIALQAGQIGSFQVFVIETQQPPYGLMLTATALTFILYIK